MAPLGAGYGRIWSRLALAASALVLVAACSTPPAPGTSTPPATPAAGETDSPLATSTGTGHYSIDVANVGGGHHKGAGHHEGDGAVDCVYTADSGWHAHGVYFPNDPAAPGRDISEFEISATPGHESVHMTLMDHTTDDLTDWIVQAGFDHPVFHFSTDDQRQSVTTTAVASDSSNTITIVATCSLVERG